jgi:hypothetical protein
VENGGNLIVMTRLGSEKWEVGSGILAPFMGVGYDSRGIYATDWGDEWRPG